MATAPTNLEKALRGFVSAVEDLATLEVTTYTGTIKIPFKAAAVGGKNTGELDWDKLLESCGGPTGELVLVAATKIYADYDTVNFRSSTAPKENIEELLSLHERAVRTSREGREAIVKMFVDSLKLLVPAS